MSRKLLQFYSQINIVCCDIISWWNKLWLFWKCGLSKVQEWFFFIISKLEAFPIYDIMMESLLLHSPMADVKFLFKRCFKLPLPVWFSAVINKEEIEIFSMIFICAGRLFPLADKDHICMKWINAFIASPVKTSSWHLPRLLEHVQGCHQLTPPEKIITRSKQ